MDKSALKRAYKEGKRPMGVLKITCTGSDTVFIGAGTDLPARINRHKAELRFGGHRIKALQKAWRDHGEDAFAFEVIDELDHEKEPHADPAEELQLLVEMWTGKLEAAGLTVVNI